MSVITPAAPAGGHQTRAGRVGSAATTHRTSAAPSPAELRLTRELLGLSSTAMADALSVAHRTLERWESGIIAIPEGIGAALEALERTSEAAVDHYSALAATDGVLLTYFNDSEYRSDVAGAPAHMTASWHRRVIARAARRVPGTRVRYSNDPH